VACRLSTAACGLARTIRISRIGGAAEKSCRAKCWDYAYSPHPNLLQEASKRRRESERFGDPLSELPVSPPRTNLVV